MNAWMLLWGELQSRHKQSEMSACTLAGRRGRLGRNWPAKAISPASICRSLRRGYFCMQVGGMRHPLLLQASLDPLPAPPSAASEDTELSYLDSFAPGADVPKLAPSQASAVEGAHQVRHIHWVSSPACCKSHAAGAACSLKQSCGDILWYCWMGQNEECCLGRLWCRPQHSEGSRVLSWEDDAVQCLHWHSSSPRQL